MKSLFLLLIALMVSGNIYLSAEQREPVPFGSSGNDGCEYHYSFYNTYASDSLTETKRDNSMSGEKRNHGIKGRILRLDRKYDRLIINGVKDEFKGHLPVFEMGVNTFVRTDYSGYSVPDFMDLNQGKSLEVNLRVFKVARGLQLRKNNIGIVTGLELNLNDYRFSGPYTLVNEEGYTNPVLLQEEGLSKTKLTTTFVTVPLLIEFQLPAKMQENRIYISGGIIGGLKLGSHTKVEQFGHKMKDHNDFNINPFRWGATFRIGFKDINIFATYYKTSFFEEGRGPEMFPFTVGIGLINK